MLRRRWTWVAAVVLLLPLAAGPAHGNPVALASGPSAMSADPIKCPDGMVPNQEGICVLTVQEDEDETSDEDGPGKDGASSTKGANRSAGGAPVSAGNSKKPCRDQGRVIPCVKDGAWWSASNACYVAAVDPPPAKSDPVWEGNENGAIYSCAGPVGGGGSVSDLAGDVRVVGPQGCSGRRHRLAVDRLPRRICRTRGPWLTGRSPG